MKPGCGEEAVQPGEQRIMSRYGGKCSVCKGKVMVGDWVRWHKVTKRVRHAPTGYRTEEFPEPTKPAARKVGMGLG